MLARCGFSRRWRCHDVARSNRGRENGGASYHSYLGGVVSLNMSLTSETLCCVECGKPLPMARKRNAKYCAECIEKRRAEQHRTFARRYAAAHRDEYKAYLKERYLWLTSHNMCVSCGHEKAVEGRVRCLKCLERYRKKKPVA